MKIFKQASKQRGSMVVEASLVVPIVIFCIFAVIYFAMLLYQQVFVQVVANKAAERGAAAWSNKAKNMESGMISKQDLSGAGLYWRLVDSEKESKEEKIKSYIKSNLGRYSLLSDVEGGKNEMIVVDLKDYIIYKKLTVTVENTYKIPLGKLLGRFGINERYTISVKSEAAINDPVEFIRNTDFVLDIERELEEKNPGIKNLGEKTRNAITGLKEKVADFSKQEASQENGR